MDAMAARHADRGVTSVFVYVREAHPGENYPHHESMDDKRTCARAFKETCAVTRAILLDDLEGTVHRAYGLLPNMTWILGRGGVVHYRATWTHPEDVEDALEHMLEAERIRRKTKGLARFYSERLVHRERQPEAFRAGLERAGPKAVREFFNPKKH